MKPVRDSFPGGTLSGTSCFVVATDEVDSLLLDIRETFGFDAAAVYLAPT